tara:strand:- start:1863 stop:2066 length:204 start_codon:yes stop_codon:yes gene_type:complete
VIDKALIKTLLLLMVATASILIIYLAISPYQNCKRDMVDSFEETYGNSSTWSERTSLIKRCVDSTKW